jgi:hypothetical protein
MADPTSNNDVEGALKAGYSPAEIADHLGATNNFNVDQARKAGYSDAEIINQLAGTKLPTGPAPVPAAAPEAPPSPLRRAASVAANLVPSVGLGEAGLSLGTQMIATPVAGLAGIAQGVKNTFDRATGNPEGMSAADRVGQVGSALTYQPRSDVGKQATALIAKPAEWLASGADKAGQAASDITGSPAVGAAVNTGVQALPALLLKGAGRLAAPAADAGAATATAAAQDAATAAAKDYAVNKAGLNWDSLSDSIKAKLTAVAGDAKNLDNLDPEALAREAKLQSLPVPVPATRGQLTRDPVALRNEGNVSATAAGAPIRDIHLDQNQALLDNLDVLKGKVTGTGTTASQATTPQAAGASLQGAARAKLEFQQAKVKQLYQAAQDSGETAQKVDVTPIQDLISKTPDQTHYGYAKSWIGQNTERSQIPGAPTTTTDSLGMRYDGPVSDPTPGPRQVSINDLEDLRKAAVAKAMNGGEDGYYAGKLISAIDTATDGAGGDLYKAARAARKQQALEFGDQGAVAKLVDDKSRTDRTTALENTVKSIANGSLEDVQNVKRTLLTGGDASTRTAGKTAWRDLRASVIQDIKDRATNGVALNERDQLHITPAAMKRAVDSYGPAKLDEIFGPGTHRQLYNILDATRTLKAQLPSAAVGSSTMANMMTFLEKGITKIPGGGTVADLARGAAQMRNAGAAARAAQTATSTPLSEMVNKSAAAQSRATTLAKLGAGSLNKGNLIPLSLLNAQAGQQANR